MPLLAWRFTQGPAINSLPEEMAERLRAYRRANLARNLWLRQTALRTIELLQAAGIAAIPLKGPLLAESLYGNPGLRQCHDVDILVRHADVPAARDTLMSAGYSSVSPLTAGQFRQLLRHNCEYQLRSSDGALVELHWRLLPRYFSVDFPEPELWEHAGTGAGGTTSLSPLNLFLALLINGGKERWARLITICDLAWTMRANPELDWDMVRERARRLGIERWVGMGLAIAQRLFGAQPPPSLAARDPVADHLADEYCRDLPAGATALSDDQLHRFLLRVRERRRHRVRYLLRLAVTVGPAEWEMVRLPDWLAPAYYLIRVTRLGGNLLRALAPRRRSRIAAE